MDTLAGHVIRNASVKASSQSGINPILGNPIHSLRPGGTQMFISSLCRTRHDWVGTWITARGSCAIGL